MQYKDMEILQFAISIRIGDEYKSNGIKNKILFSEKIKNMNTAFPYSFEWGVDDLFFVYLAEIDYKRNQISYTDMYKLTNAYDELSKLFKNVKMNVLLSGFTDEGNCIDLSIGGFLLLAESWMVQKETIHDEL